MFKHLIVLTAVVLHFPIAFAGGDMSGGGSGFVCFNPDGSVKDAELLDLWEGDNLPGFRNQINISYSNDSIDDQLKRALAKIGPADKRFQDDVKAALAELRSPGRHAFVGENVEIDTPTDTGHNYSKTGCPLKGIAFYDSSTRTLGIKKKYYDALTSETARAGLWLHEAVYKVMRDKRNEATSVRSRTFVACLMAQENCWQEPDIMDSLPKDEQVYQCAGNRGTNFYAYRKGGTVWKVLVEKIGDYGMDNEKYSNTFKTGLDMELDFDNGSRAQDITISDVFKMFTTGNFTASSTFFPNTIYRPVPHVYFGHKLILYGQPDVQGSFAISTLIGDEHVTCNAR